MNAIVTKAPGRINIIGEHTDYNEGFVLPAAIDRYIEFELARNGTNLCHITAADLNQQYTFDLHTFAPKDSGWENYVMGVVSELQKMEVPIGGFDASFKGSIPVGGGVSSSAALENSLALGLLKIFPKDLSDWQIIKACQMAEHNFPGIKCGIMDQFSSMLGKADHVMLLDCRDQTFKYFPWSFEEYQILLINSNVSHELASSEYNTRRSECQAGVQRLQEDFPDVQSLRDVSEEMLASRKNDLSSTVYNRCWHVITENQRVLQTTQNLEKANLKNVGQLMYQSHDSLSKKYEVSCVELDFLVNETRKLDSIVGSRMMGGGFGGCTINLVKKEATEEVGQIIAENYFKEFQLDCTPMVISISDGAKALNQSEKLT